MQFLARFTSAEATRLLDAGRRMQLGRGDYLIRRGDKGGDLYLVESGALEVVDTRSRPEVVLEVLGPGALVGEMAFLDESPRAADVRATVDTTCCWWEHAQLLAYLAADTAFASIFYRSLAGTVADRARSVTTDAVTGGIARRRAGRSQGTDQPGGDHFLKLRDAALRARSRFFRADTQLRRDPEHAGARVEVHDTVRDLVADLDHWIGELADVELQIDAAHVLQAELQPYVARARTGALLLGQREAGAGTLEARVHMLSNRPDGEGPFGEELDRALLSLPTLQALRQRLDRAMTHVREAMGSRPPAQVLVINGAAGGIVPPVLQLAGPVGGVVTCLEGERDSLALLGLVDAGGAELRLVQDDLVRLCTGRSVMHHEPQDLIVVDGLVEHLPDRLTAALLNWCHDRLTPGGVLVVTALERHPDQGVLDHVLGWPMVRRAPDQLVQLVEAAGLDEARLVDSPEDGAGGLVVSGVGGIRGLARQGLEA
jgi:CRP-like cAMP-binding protein